MTEYEGRLESEGPISVLAFDAIDSTNTEAMRRAATGERGPLWLRADRQLAGKGRSGRAWQSPSGNLSATLLFTPGCDAGALGHLSLIAGVAVHDAVCRAFEAEARTPPSGLRLKWPNDVMIDQAKLAGILIETSIFSGQVVAAVGCGLNITVTPPVEARTVTRLADHGLAIKAPGLLALLSAAMWEWLAVWDRGAGFSAVRTAWLDRAGPGGTPLTVNTGSGPVRGEFAGLDDEGALLLADPAGMVRRFHYGDVTFAASAIDPTGETE